MSDLDNAINSINASAAKAENTATFLDDMSTFDDQSSVTNPNNGQTVASIPKQVKDRTDELFTAAESDINQAVADAAQSATDAQDAADSIGRYQGLWPDTGGIADKGDTYQTQVSGTPTGQYFTALQNTTVDPVDDDVNWRVVVSLESFSQYTDRVYKASGVSSAIDNMLADFNANPLAYAIGTVTKTGGTTWEYVDSTGPITESNFRAFNAVWLRDFGVVGDGVTDDTVAVQKAVKYCIDNSVDLNSPSVPIRLTDTIYIPKHTYLDRMVDLNFGGARFLPEASGTVFESGEFNGTSWVSKIESPDGGFNSFNLTIGKLAILGGRYGLRLNNWHQGCRVYDVTANECNTVLDLNHCFYTLSSRIRSFSSAVRPWTDERYIIRGSSNLMEFKSMVGTNAGIMYKFDNPVGGFAVIDMEDCSLEGAEIAIETTGIVSEISITGGYTESVYDTIYKFNNEVRSGLISTSFKNINAIPTVYIFDAENNAASRLKFDASNELLGFPESRLFKNSESGFNSFIIDKGNSQANSLDDIALDSDDYPLNCLVTGYKNFGFNEATAELNRGIVPCVYSGRTTRGYELANKLYGCVEKTVTATAITYSTKIVYQERQWLFFSVRVADGGNKDYNGFVFNNTFYEFTPTGIAPNSDVGVSEDGFGFTEFQIGNLTAATGTAGAEVRVIS